jgi:tetratricopeptide (TPR) repeat protein
MVNMVKNKHLLLIFLICLIANFSFSQTYFEEGKKEYYASNYSRSIELLTKAILNDQEIAKSLMYRGAVKIFLNQLDDALTDLESSKQIDSSFPRLYFYFGKLYLIRGEYDLAITNYSKAIAGDLRDAAAYNERSNAKALKNDLNGALIDANVAISIDSTKENFYTDRGYTKVLLKQYKAAIKDFNTSLRMEPNPKAYADRGIAYSMMNQHQKAIEDYTKALEFNQEDAEILYYRGISYKALAKKAAACTDLKKSNEAGYPKSAAVLKELKCDQ